jgi:hypothetical protein
MPLLPLSLSDESMTLLLNLAEPIPRDQRGAILEAVAARLRSEAVLGDGAVSRDLLALAALSADFGFAHSSTCATARRHRFLMLSGFHHRRLPPRLGHEDVGGAVSPDAPGAPGLFFGAPIALTAQTK